MMMPLAGSTPERNEMGASETRSLPLPVPFAIDLALIITMTPNKW